MEKTSRCKEQGQQQERVHGQTGADAEQPFSLSQPNREELCHLSLAVWGSLGNWDTGSADWIAAHSNSVPAVRTSTRI